MKKNYIFINALILFGGAVSDARGSVAGNTYSRNKSGSYLRNRTKPINRNTFLQQNARAIFKDVSTSWQGLTDAQRNGWREASILFPQKNKLGQTYTPSGFQLFMMLNQNLSQVNETTLLEAPAPSELPNVTDPVVTLAALAASLIISGTVSDPANVSVIIQATPPLSSGKQNANNVYRFLTFVSGTDLNAGTEDLLTAYQSAYSVTLTNTPVQNIKFRIALVKNDTGERTTWMEIPYVVA